MLLQFHFQGFLTQQWNVLVNLYYPLVLLSLHKIVYSGFRAMSLGLRSFIDVCVPLYSLEKRPMWEFLLGRENSLEHMRPSCHNFTLSWEVPNLLPKCMNMYRGFCLSCLNTWGMDCWKSLKKTDLINTGMCLKTLIEGHIKWLWLFKAQQTECLLPADVENRSYSF